MVWLLCLHIKGGGRTSSYLWVLFCFQKTSGCRSPDELALLVQEATTFAGCKLKQVTVISSKIQIYVTPVRDHISFFLLKTQYQMLYFILRSYDKSGGWGDVLRVRSNTRSHERSARLHHWDLQRWRESASCVGASGERLTTAVTVTAVKHVNTCLHIDYVHELSFSFLVYSKSSSWSLVLCTRPQSLK